MTTELVAAAEQAAAGVFRIELRYPPIESVNVLAFPEAEGLTLVDTGPGAEAYLPALDQALRGLGIGGVDTVTKIYLTHTHTDHIGQAGAIQRESGAQVHAHPDAMAFFHRRYVPEHNERLLAWFEVHGLPPELLGTLAPTFPVRPQPPDETLPYGPEASIQGHAWRVIETSGHAPGHVALHRPDAGWLLAGDAVLEGIVPLVDIQPFRDQQTMHLYLEGLALLRDLPISLVLPAHGEPFPHGAARAGELLAKHTERIDRVLGACTGQWRSAYEIFRAAWGHEIRGTIKMRLAFAQVIGYLGYLEIDQRVERRSDSSRVQFRLRAG